MDALLFSYFLAVVKKKRDFEMHGDQPKLTKTDGRFETYTGDLLIRI
jgi:hypothetical protein